MLSVFGLGFPAGRGFAIPNAIPLSFFDLGYWDLAALAGLDADVVSSGIASPVGANVLSPVSSPTLDDAAIAGRRALQLKEGTSQYLRCDALATRFAPGVTWTMAMSYRTTALTGDQPLACAGNSAGAGSNYFQIRQSSLGKVQIVSNTAGGGTITRLGTLDQAFDDHLLVVTSTGTTLAAYIDGSEDALDNAAIDPNPITLNRFAVGAFLNAAVSTSMDGYVQWFGMSSSVMSPFEAALFAQQLQAGNFTRPKTTSKQVMWVGDSITETSVDTARGAGIREYELQWVVDNGLSINHVGSRILGRVPDRENVAQGGASCSTIATNVANAIAADPTMAPDLVIVMMGTNNISGGSTATQLAAYRSAINSIYATTVARNPAVKIAASTITPVQPGTSPADANWSLFNAGLVAAGTGEWDVFEAAHPGVLIRCDNAAALGNAWSSTDFGADTTHPNEVGVQKIGARGIAQNYGLTIRALSPTLKALTCLIKAPAASASLPYGTPVTISGRVSRYPSTVQVKLGATVLGSATMNKRDWSYSWTPLVGDLGAQTINATVTDTLDGTTADAAGVSVTVSAPSATYGDYGTLIVFMDGRDAASKTISGSDVVAWNNKATNVALTEATRPPSVAAAWCNGKDGVFFDKKSGAADGEQLLGGADAALSAALNHTAGAQNKSYAIGYLVEFQNVNDIGIALGFANASSSNQGIYAGQRTTNKVRSFRQDASANVMDPTTLPATAAGKQIVTHRYDGAAGMLYVAITPLGSSMGTEVSFASTLAGALSITRFCMGCRGDGSTDSHIGGTYGDVWAYSGLVSLASMGDAVALCNARWA